MIAWGEKANGENDVVVFTGLADWDGPCSRCAANLNSHPSLTHIVEAADLRALRYGGHPSPRSRAKGGAGYGDRTRVRGLGSLCTTIVLSPLSEAAKRKCWLKSYHARTAVTIGTLCGRGRNRRRSRP